MSSLSGASTDTAPSPGHSPSHLNDPALILFLVTSVWFWHNTAQDCRDEPFLGHISACAFAISMAVTISKALWQRTRTSLLTLGALEGVRNALQTNFLSVIVLNSLLAIPASQVSACSKLFSPEASTAFFQIESHLFSTQVSNLSGALCIISQSALPCTIYPNLVSSVNYITMPFSSSSI